MLQNLRKDCGLVPLKVWARALFQGAAEIQRPVEGGHEKMSTNARLSVLTPTRITCRYLCWENSSHLIVTPIENAIPKLAIERLYLSVVILRHTLQHCTGLELSWCFEISLAITNIINIHDIHTKDAKRLCVKVPLCNLCFWQIFSCAICFGGLKSGVWSRSLEPKQF